MDVAVIAGIIMIISVVVMLVTVSYTHLTLPTNSRV